MSLKYEFVENPAKLVSAQDFANLMGVAFGESPDRFTEFYKQKHLDNPFGPSYAGLVFHGEKLVGMNFFMRWQFAKGKSVLDAVQSCDTAVHPDHWGKGIFSKIQNLCMENISSNVIRYGFPNYNSAPGFKKLGWITAHGFRKSASVCRRVAFITRRVLQRNHEFSKEPRTENALLICPQIADYFYKEIENAKQLWETRRTQALYDWRLSMNESLNIGSITRNGEIVALIAYEIGALKNHPGYRLCSIVDIDFDNQAIDAGKLLSKMRSLWKKLRISECSYHTNLSKKKCNFYRETYSRPAALIFHPGFGWSEELTLEQFMTDSNVTSFDSDHV